MATSDSDDLREERRQEQIIPPDDAETGTETVRLYDAAWAEMPPGTAGSGVEAGGEAAASRRVAGLPLDLEQEPEHRVGEPTPGAEPFLGYDSLTVDDLIGWIEQADPDPEDLRRLYEYEGAHRRREAVLHDVSERLRRFGERPDRRRRRRGS